MSDSKRGKKWREEKKRGRDQRERERDQRERERSEREIKKKLPKTQTNDPNLGPPQKSLPLFPVHHAVQSLSLIL